MKGNHFSFSPFGLLAAALLLGVLAVPPASAQTTYTWSSTASTNWSTSANWGGAGVPGAGDTANILNTTGSTITYDAGASGTLGTLNMTTATGSGTTKLLVSTPLTLTVGGSIYSTKASTYETLTLSGTAALTIASGATFTVGTGSSSLISSSSISTSTTTAYLNTASGYSGSGVVVNGTLDFITAASGSSTSAQLYVNAPVVIGAGGTLNVDTESATYGTRTIIAGNFTTSASANTISASSSLSSAASTLGNLYLMGSTINIGAGTTFSGFADGTGGTTPGVVFYQTAAGTQTISLGAVTGFTIRNAAGSAATIIEKISSTAVSNSVSNAIDTILFQTTSIAGDNMTLQLASNLNFAGGSYTLPFVFSLQGSSLTATIDLNGFTYDATAGTSTVGFSASGSSAGSSQYIAIVNSGSGSISSNQGIFKAAAINLGGADVSVGSNVILQASAGGSSNDLGNKDATSPTTIDSTSTFYYTGTGTTATLKSTNNRTIGGLIVGTGSSASTLKLASAITAAGNVTPSAGATLDLGGFGLALTGSASLTGAGTITNSSTTVASTVSFASGATGGLSPGGAGVAATLTFTAPTKAITISLANSTSVFDITSAGLGAGTFDSLSLSNTTLDLTGGAFVIDFGTGTYNGSIQLISLASGSAITGSLSSLTSNLGAAESLSLSSTGVLTFSAVPEPSTTALLFAGAGCLAWIAWRRRAARAV
ncbi:PEP-CTERM protein-sorting domain-containing protein [Verrucomicrobium sp. GAS474]|uniref:beta strand repeat-containing protein n=1 Tax=Verrucomicrobium sp. GAS474 TaxID=1882831 RepID=UPI00087975EF|nr:PEP-CTERM sorting domain-containing protein [Verrucomicrobium sp. GAS474]SDU29409.1 PEP-CTERM protein-sorting domain-containing protein [Verrucomicrobium sp. GAS474]